MKYIRAEAPPLDTMELTKMRLVVNGQDGENIWIKEGPDGKSYLQNHSVNFYPFPSWGLEVPTCDTYDLKSLRQSPDDTVLTIHPEAYDAMIEAGHINEEGILQEDVYFNQSEDE